jgi:hypothetical protein
MTDNKFLDPIASAFAQDENDDYSDLVCALCRTGGDMICCDGRCLRSFHPKCIGLNEEDIPEDSPFVCSDCFSGVQRCFACCHFGLENELIKCSVKYCGKFYHPECVKTLTSSDEDYVCKLHSCDSCGDVVTNPMKRQLLWRCFRCPKAFDSKHRPRDVHVLAEGLFLCIRHTQEEEVWPDMPKKLADRLEQRNQVTFLFSFDHCNLYFLIFPFSLPSSSDHSQQSADWEKKISNGLQTNGRNFSSFLEKKSDKKLKSQTQDNSYRPGESEQQRQKRLKKEEKDRLDDEATVRASSIMPKKRQSTEGDLSDYDEDEPCFSPASVGGGDHDGHGHAHSDTRAANLNSPHLSHLARHNEYRRQRKGEWNQSWNQYREIQDQAMGITGAGSLSRRHRDESYYPQPYTQPRSGSGSEDYDYQHNYYHSHPLGPPPLSSQFASTFSSTMDRTNTMLSHNSYLYPSSYSPGYSTPSYSPPSPPPLLSSSSNTVLTRTSALLSQLSDVPQQSMQNKRVKHDHSSFSSTGVVLSRTEQLLAKTSPAVVAPLSHAPPPSSSSRPTLSRTEQILAMTSSSSNYSSSHRNTSSNHHSAAATKAHHGAPKAKENKMEATDLFAMLQASGLLPTK